MLERMTLENFRSWRGPVDIGLKPVTIIFGNNSSGKTALLDALLMLKQTAESADRKLSLAYTGHTDLGSFRDVIHGHNEDLELRLKLKWRPRERFTLSAPEETREVHAEAVEYEARWRQMGDVTLTYLGYASDPVTFSLKRGTEGGYEPKLQAKPIRLGTPRRGRPASAPSQFIPESCYALPRRVALDWPHLDLLEFTHQFELLMDRIHYLGPLRQFPRREFLWTGESPGQIGKDGTGAVEALIAVAREGQSRSKRSPRRPKDLLDSTREWLGQIGLAERLQVVQIDAGGRYYQIQLVAPGGRTPTLLPDVGFGVSQVLPVIIQLYFAPEGSILLFEQPEIHLHPSAASCLADLFLDVAHERNLQLIIESHSESLLTRLQRRIAEGEKPYATPDRIGLYFCRLRDGGSTIEPVTVNGFGQIENWPQSFFGDVLADVKAVAEAMARGRHEGAR